MGIKFRGKKIPAAQKGVTRGEAFFSHNILQTKKTLQDKLF